MQFELDGQKVVFEVFAQKHPDESLCLNDYDSHFPEVVLSSNNGVIELVYPSFKGIFIDIEQSLNHHKTFFYKNSPYKDPLAKALGLKPGLEKPVVLDASAGLLGDSCLIHSYGVKTLQLMERHPLVAILIINALKRYPLENTDFVFGSALELETEDIDVIYFDPMYGEKNTKASPKKEMKIFRALIGEDWDRKECALKLLDKAKKRLVLKRSNKATPLLEKPDFTIKGKSTCYDVYLKHSSV